MLHDAEAPVGKWEQIARDDCHRHKPMFPPSAALIGRDVFFRRSPRQKLLYIYPNPHSAELHDARDAPWEWFEPAHVNNVFSESTWESRPRLVNSGWINLDLLKAWFLECKAEHQAECGLEETSGVGDIFLVDVSRQCLILGNRNSEYVALSYVWGQTKRFTTLTSNLEQVMQPGAFAETEIERQLPRTIAQAIKLTHALGFSFLWCDALCIVQDAKDKYAQLNEMASIYSTAVLTIVAAQGTDANVGFRGLPGISEPRYIQQLSAPIHPYRQLLKPSSKQVWHDALLHPWSSRAWTFQEGILSRRVLYFSHDSVRWACRKSRWSEESDSMDCMVSHGTLEQRQHSVESPRCTSSRLPTMREYESLVNGFNRRELTFPEDAMFAFAGVSRELARKFAYGLVSGLPALFFDLCLLWQPLRRTGPAIRRVHRTNTAGLPLPSWSWAGWETEVSWPYTWDKNSGSAGPSLVISGDVRPFYRIKEYHIEIEGVKTTVSCDWLVHATLGIDKRCPAGWSRYEVNLFDDEFGNRNEVPYFQHELDSSLAFWALFPISDSPGPSHLVDKVYFRGTIGRFKFGRAHRHMTQLLTWDGTHAGVLFQHSEKDDSYIRALNEATSIELVAILGCVVASNDYRWWDSTEDPAKTNATTVHQKAGRISQVYNVLWIERNGETAYRKGSGEVDRYAWDKTVAGVETNVILA